MQLLRNIIKKIIYTVPSSKVLMFHHVTEMPRLKKSGCLLATEKFYEEIEMFHLYASLEDVIKHPERKKIAITFDDGLEDLYTIAYPFLIERNIPFTAFIVTDYIDKPGYITKEQLVEMAKNPLVTIGSHGVSHKIFTEMRNSVKRYELIESKRILEQITGKEVEIFAFSHGQYDKETLTLMDMYKYGMTVVERPLNIFTSYNKKSLPRYNIDNTTVDMVNRKLR